MAGPRNILLINPAENDEARPYEFFPSGALILMGTMLVERGHNVKLLHMVADRVGEPDLRRTVAAFKPDVVGLTMSTYQTRSAKQISRIVKDVDAGIPVVVGGPHPSALRGEILRDFPCVDLVVVGEGEHALIDIVEGKDPAGIPGVCSRGVESGPAPLAADLDFVPLPRLDLIDVGRFTGADPHLADPSMFVMGSRGCPFNCTFCNKSVWGQKVRFRQPARVVDEVEWLYGQYGIREIFFTDDTFNLNRRWAEEVCQLLIDRGLNRKMVFATAFRANDKLVDEKLLRLVRAAGFWLLFYGVESGSQEMLDAMDKGLKLDEIRRAIRLTHEAGIKTKAAFMIGLPGETEATINQTIRFWRELNPFITGFGPAIPFPGTEFERIVLQKGHKLVSGCDDFTANTVSVRTDALDKDQLTQHMLRFRRLIIRKFLLDFFRLRYLGVLLFSLRSPRYIKHILRRIKSYLDV